ncbi:hypothetical protein HPB50_019366 [Hyalomma asiaticum]|uniref:Uncharacterized protein n=1 Tax=Hyalomma asiaticum TaxID=266040 RepID=A0ACB7SJQ4_HYAAI|nr:hypothetical protein HPB50_019366 [Hyalomma asiaticum]
MRKSGKTRIKPNTRSHRDRRTGSTYKDAELRSPASGLQSPSERELPSPISSPSLGSAEPAQARAAVASRASSSQANVAISNEPSRVASGATSPSSAFLLPGFVETPNWDAIQENAYVVLGHGPFQRRVLMCGILCVTVLLFQYLAYRLIGRQVDHWCMAPDHSDLLPADAWKNISIPVEADGSYSRCTMYDPSEPEATGLSKRPSRSAREAWSVLEIKWDEKDQIGKPKTKTGPLFHAASGSYAIRSKADSVVSRFDMVCDREYLYDLSTVVPMLGSCLVSPALGLAADRVGRKPIMVACAFAQLFATIANSMAQTYTLFVLTRFLIFATTDVTFLVTFSLIHEVTGNARRSMFTLVDTGLPGIVVPPLMHALSLLEPRWMLANALTIVTAGLLAVWCRLQEESPAWLIATRKLSRAEAVLLLAANENGVDVAKARLTFMAMLGQLRKLDKNAAVDPMEGIVETMKLRRRAISVLLARFTIDATYINIMFNDVTTGIAWEVGNVVASVACYATAYGCMRSCGIRETLSGIMIILSAFSLFEALAIFVDQKVVSLFVHAGMKAFASAALSVTLCYTAETFPTAVRNAGISFSHFAGGMGSIMGTIVIDISGYHAFYVLSAFMVLLSVMAIQWLPEVVIERARSPSLHSERDRKAALLASLQPRDVKPPRKKR